MEALMKDYASDSSDENDEVEAQTAASDAISEEIQHIVCKARHSEGEKRNEIHILNENKDSKSSNIERQQTENDTNNSHMKTFMYRDKKYKDDTVVVVSPGNSLCLDQEKNVTDNKEKSDFFGLSFSYCDKPYKDKLLTEKIKDQVTAAPIQKITVEGQSVDVEIPNTSFWESISETDLQTLQQLDKNKHSPINLKKNAKRENQIDGHKRPHSSNEASAKCIKQSKLSNLSSPTPVESLPVKAKRKMYFVHPKMSPHLHAPSPQSRLPSSQECAIPAHAGVINRVKWNISNYSHLFVTCSMDSSIKVWNIWSQLDPCLQTLCVHQKAVKDIDWNSDGKQLLSCSYDKSVAITDVEIGKAVCRFDHCSFVTCVKYHPVNPWLCVSGEHNQIQVWDSRSPHVPCKTFTYKDDIGQVQDVVFTKDGSTLFSSSDVVSRDTADRNLMAWDFSSGVTLSNQMYQERYTLTRLKIRQRDNTLLAQSQGNYVAIFSLQRPYKMNKHKRFDKHKVLGYSVGFDLSPDGQMVYSGSSDGNIYVYNYQSGKLHKTINAGSTVVMDVSCHPLLSSTVAVCTWDGMVQVWK